MSAGVIRIAVRKFGPFETALQKLWGAYCKQTGCTLQAEMIPLDLDDLHQTTLAVNGLKNGDWDIAHIVTDWLYEAFANGALEDLQPYIDQNPPDGYPLGWSSSLLGMQQFGKAVVGLPFHDGPECLIYRKDLFEDEAEKAEFLKRYGKPLEVPQTWDDFKTIARFSYRPEQNLYGSVFAGLPDGHNTVFDFCLQLWTRGGELIGQNGKITINTSAALEGLTYYRDILRDSKAVHPNTMQYESVQTGMAFARGEAAMMVNWFGFASMCEVIGESRVKGKVDIAPVPHSVGNQSASLNVYWLYTIGSGSRHKQIAYDFIRFATSAANDKLLTTEGGIGCRISTWNDKEINAIIPYYHKLEELHRTAKSLPQHKNWAQIAHIIDDVVLQAINTKTPLQQLLNEGQKRIDMIDETLNIPYKPVLPKTPLPIVVIGAGGIVGDAHLPAYKKAGFNVVGITNRTRARAERLAEQFGIPNVYDTVEDAVANAPANAVYDITIMPEQFVATLDKLPDGSAVLIQKPMGDYFWQSKEILEVCRKKNLRAAINCQLRFAPYVSAARYLIQQGLIGELYDMEVRVTLETPWELFPHVMIHPRLEIQYHSIHYIDLIRSFLGEPKSVMAKTLRHPAKSLSSSRSTILFDYGDTMHAIINTNHDHSFGPHNQESFIKWEGTKGAIKARMGLLMDYPHGVPDKFEYCIMEEGKQPEWKEVQLEGSWFPDAFIGTMSSLMRYQLGETDVLPTSVEDVIKTMAVVESAYISSDNGGVVVADRFN